MFTLHNGIAHPRLGMGTYQLLPEAQALESIAYAIKKGIRHFDSAIIYRNEKALGEAIRQSGLPREDFFITSKCPPHIKQRDGVMRMFERSLKNTGFDYFDAYILNAPGPFDDLDGDYDEGNVEAYQALESLYKEERVRAIGVSQFKERHINLILERCSIVPHLQQISYFVGHTQEDLVSLCQKHGIHIQAFSPLGKGYLLHNESLKTTADTLNLTPAQLACAYVLNRGHAPIPKATSFAHIDEIASADVVLSDDVMETLNRIVDDPRQYND